MQKTPHVLISGASVAGPALAYWLHRHGLRATIVERAPALRTGGQAVDLRGAALDVADRMGLIEPLRAASTRMRGMSFVDDDGHELFRTTDGTLTGGPGDIASIEFLREDLVRLLHDATRGDVEYLFDDAITALVPCEGGVLACFARGPARIFDLVVGADGAHSGVRALAFGPEADHVRHLGMYLATFSMPNYLGLDHWQIFLRGAEQMVGVSSARDDRELTVFFGFGAPPVAFDHRDLAWQRRFVADRFAGMGWETPRLLDALRAADDLYFDAMTQVRMPAWSRDRVALVGDAAYAPSPMSGQGTSLALVGAFVLAAELARAPGDHAAAFAAYEARVRPFALANQQLALDAIAAGGPPDTDMLARVVSAIELPELISPARSIRARTAG